MRSRKSEEQQHFLTEEEGDAHHNEERQPTALKHDPYLDPRERK